MAEDIKREIETLKTRANRLISDLEACFLKGAIERAFHYKEAEKRVLDTIELYEKEKFITSEEATNFVMNVLKLFVEALF